MVPIATACALVLAGLGLPGGAADPDDLRIAMRYDDCDGITLPVLVPTGHLAPFLPPGYRAGDFAGFLPLPVRPPLDTGFTNVHVNAFSCRGFEPGGRSAHIGEGLVFIEPPAIPGLSYEPEALHFYEFAYHHDIAWQHDLFASLGARSEPGTSEIAFALGGAPGPGQGAVSAAGGRLYEADGLGALPVTLGPVYVWQDTSQGTLYYRISFEGVTMHLGLATGCQLRPGSLHAAVFGFTECTMQPALFGIFDGQDFTADLVFLSGVHPAV